MSLSNSEKEDLLNIIEVLFGHDSEIARLKDSFNVRTIEAVEEALETLVRCNANMRSLVVGLIGGAGLFVGQGNSQRSHSVVRRLHPPVFPRCSQPDRPGEERTVRRSSPLFRSRPVLDSAPLPASQRDHLGAGVANPQCR